MADKIKALDALDKSGMASIRATMYLNEARSALREGGPNMAFDLSAARDEIGAASAFLTQAEAALQQLESGDGDQKGR
ncbi:MAG: hypothetical protein ACYCZN_01305 [Candidatus Dormibacteria bacterium]